MSPKALAPGSLVLTTGVNGYIAAHVADLLLKQGYKVRGTVRDQAKIDIVNKGFAKHRGQFEAIILKDVSSHDAFAHVVKGCDGVVHVASDLSFGSDPNIVVTGTIKAMHNVLAAVNEEPKVKRFVYTSSTIAAASAIWEGTPAGVIIDNNSWNKVDVEKAWAPPPYEPERGISCYAASKVQAEEAAWKFVKENKPYFVLNTVLPAFCIGPKLFPQQNLSTSGWVQGLYENNTEDIQRLQNFPPIWTVDVRDIARLHVAGLLEEDVVGQRLLAATDSTNYNGFTSVLSKLDPKHGEFEPAPGKLGLDKATWKTEYSEKLIQRFGRPGLTHIEETLRDQLAAAH